MNSPGPQMAESAAAGIDPHAVHEALQPSTDTGTQTQPLFRRSERTCRLTGFRIQGVGTQVPERVITNEELEGQYGFEPGWIERRTGILKRHLIAPDQGTSDIAVGAAKAAMKDAGVFASEIDLLIIGTFTPDYVGPSTACLVQHRLGLDVPAMDLQAACSGFMYSLVTAGQFVATGNAKCALVIGADVVSRICRPTDQRVAPLFGDGAGATILKPGTHDQGLLCYQLGSDGSKADLLLCPVGGSRQPASVAAVASGEHFLRMDGRNVFKWAIQVVTETIDLILKKSGVTVEDVDVFVLHQANIRIIDHAVKVLGIPPEKVLTNVDEVGNTSAASIPLVLGKAQQQGRIHTGDLVLMSGFGAGLTWGTGLFRW